MKGRIFIAALAALATYACQTSKPASPFGVHAEIMAETAANINTAETYLSAGYDNGAAVIYTKGGASVLLHGRQHEVEGKTTNVEGDAWLCTDSLTGDFIKIYPYTGVTTWKVSGQTFTFVPDESGTKIASQKTE